MLLSKKDKEQISNAIARAELKTSGEIRVCVEEASSKEAYLRAIECFEKLKMNQTQLRNGVLIYVAFKDKKFAIIGDEGIDKKVSQDFWNTTKRIMEKHFKDEQFAEGMIQGIHLAGDQLALYFPIQEGDVNELSNDVVELNNL